MIGSQIIQLINEYKLEAYEFGVTVDNGKTVSEFEFNGNAMKIDFESGIVYLSAE